MKETNYIIFLCILIHSCEGVFAQNVGIGNPSPAEKLDVAGNVKADTLKSNALRIAQNAGIGKVLTSDAMGNGNWEELMLDSEENNGNIGYGVWGDCETNGNISGYQPMTDTSTIAPNGSLGNSVCIAGTKALAGNATGNQTEGFVSCYQHDGTEWVFVENITDPNPETNARFGFAVSITGDFAIVGSPYDNEEYVDQGSASFYQFNGTNWIFLQKVTDPTGSENDLFGCSVGISGNYAVIGASGDDVIPNDNRGSASIYFFNGTTWEWVSRIFDQDGADQDDRFGSAVSISGNHIIVGTPYDDVAGSIDHGSVCFFHFNGVQWQFAQKLSPGTGGDRFGYSVSVSDQYSIIGAPWDNVEFAEEGGSVFIYRFTSNNTWQLVANIISDYPSMFDYFGWNVSMSTNYAIVCSPPDSLNNSAGGSSTVLQRVGFGWAKLQTIYDPLSDHTHYIRANAVDGISKHFLFGVDGHPGGKIVFGKIN